MRFLYPFLAVAVALFSASSCSSGHDFGSGDISDFPVSLNFKSISRSFQCAGSTMAIDDAPALFTVASASVQWPVAVGDVDIAPMQDSIISRAFSRHDLSIDEALRFFADNPEGADAYSLRRVCSVPLISDSVMVFSRSLCLSFVHLSRRLAVIECSLSSFSGGAHYSLASSFLMFDLSGDKARHIAFSDIFISGSQPRLLEVIASALMLKHNVDSLGSLDSVGIFSDSLFVSSDVRFSGADIVFHYDPCEIAPWALGAVDVAVPFYAVSELLTPLARSFFLDSP